MLSQKQNILLLKNKLSPPWFVLHRRSIEAVLGFYLSESPQKVLRRTEKGCGCSKGGTKHKYAGDTVNIKYAGGFEYNSTNAFKRLATSEGQLVPSGDTLRFDYFIKNHLGNVRLVFDENGKVLQSTDFYPFGLSIDRNEPVTSQAARNSTNRLLYNSKELQVGTGLVDYGARMYMPEIGRWGVVDEMAELGRRWSSYTYAMNNPMRFIDPDGMWAYDAQGNASTSDPDEIRNFVNSYKGSGNKSKEEGTEPEWASKPGFGVHQKANENGIKRNGRAKKKSPEFLLQTTMIEALNNATVFADGADFQTGKTSFRHAMRNMDNGQTVEEAMNAADRFVRVQFARAKQLLKEGKIYDAYFEFGIGLHALQDATSPAHSGFQQWGNDVSAAHVVGHVKQEMFYPGNNSNLQRVTNMYLAWFQKSNAPLPKTNLFKGIQHD